MQEGYVYILSNPAMAGLIKVGQTRRSPEERARELSRNTSIPSDFIVEFEIFTLDREALEKVAHSKLEPFRINKKREFFKINVERAADIIRNEADKINNELGKLTKGISVNFEKYEAVEILDKLRERFPGIIRSEIQSVRIYQTAIRCYLEITEYIVYADREDPLIDQLIIRKDLGFIIDGEFLEPSFKPTRSIFDNVKEFIENFDSYSMLVTCSELFTKEGVEIIQDEHFSDST